MTDIDANACRAIARGICIPYDSLVDERDALLAERDELRIIQDDLIRSHNAETLAMMNKFSDLVGERNALTERLRLAEAVCEAVSSWQEHWSEVGPMGLVAMQRVETAYDAWRAAQSEEP